MAKRKVNRASFSLEDEYQDLLDRIAKMGRRNKTDELRILIDMRAEDLGLDPITPVPNMSASAS